MGTKFKRTRKWLYSLVVITCLYDATYAQQYISRNGIARFYSRTDLEDIAAENKQVLVIIDLSSKRIAVSMLMKGFLFRKELMQDHFNENYAESDRYPKAIFEGGFAATPDITGEGIFKLQVKGKLSLHGVTRAIEIPATIEITNSQVAGKAEFQVVPEDYGIRIPNLVRDKISKKVDVFIAFSGKKQ